MIEKRKDRRVKEENRVLIDITPNADDSIPRSTWKSRRGHILEISIAEIAKKLVSRSVQNE